MRVPEAVGGQDRNWGLADSAAVEEFPQVEVEDIRLGGDELLLLQRVVSEGARGGQNALKIKYIFAR